jgi:hypothetical protein
MAGYYKEEQTESPTWAVGLVFAMLTIPFLFTLCDRQDCYTTRETCEKDWNSNDCAPHTEPHCPYIGRTYNSFFRGYGYHGGGGYRGNSSIGTTSRGGFGSIGHAFGGGS